MVYCRQRLGRPNSHYLHDVETTESSTVPLYSGSSDTSPRGRSRSHDTRRLVCLQGNRDLTVHLQASGSSYTVSEGGAARINIPVHSWGKPYFVSSARSGSYGPSK